MKQKKLLRKKSLLDALAKAGLPHTMPNFVMKFERLQCIEVDCPLVGEPYLVCPWRDIPMVHKDGSSGVMKIRSFTPDQIKGIVKVAKKGWFTRHWHWKPE